MIRISRRSFLGITGTTVFMTSIISNFTKDISKSKSEEAQALSYEPGHTSWENKLETEEVYRTVLKDDEFLEIQKIEFRGKGGSKPDGLSLQVYDETTDTIIGSVDVGNSYEPTVDSSDGAVVIFRITNTSGAAQAAVPIVRGKIKTN